MYVHVYTMYVPLYVYVYTMYVHGINQLFQQVFEANREMQMQYWGNTWWPWTVYIHVYAQYVHVFAMYLPGLTICLNSHYLGVYRRYIPVCTQWLIAVLKHCTYLCQRWYRRVCSGQFASGTCIQYVVAMYSECTVHTCFNQLSQHGGQSSTDPLVPGW